MEEDKKYNPEELDNTDSGTRFVYDGIEKMVAIGGQSILKAK